MNWHHIKATGLGLAVALLAGMIGCRSHGLWVKIEPPPPKTLGTDVDQIMQTQEINAEASKYVIYAHEFQWNDGLSEASTGGWRLNPYGEDHVKQIAVNMLRGDNFPVIVERSETGITPGTQYEYPVHFNEQLDETRRNVVVLSLQALGVADADQRVMVAPAFAEGYTAAEASRAYHRGFRQTHFNSGFGHAGGFGGFR